LGTFDTDGEVILTEADPSATQLIKRAPKHEFALTSDFAISITFGEGQVMGQPMATRWLVSPLIYQDFRDGALLLARGHHASATLNHQT
jgi:hypothetical protein